MWFIGQKVVCVNDRFPQRILEWASNLPRQGEIYTIRSIEIGPCLYTRRVTIGLHLHELPTLQDRLAFRADRFVPLLEKVEHACEAKALELTSLVLGSIANGDSAGFAGSPSGFPNESVKHCEVLYA